MYPIDEQGHPHMVGDCRGECLNPEDPQSKRIFTPESCAPTLSSGTKQGKNIQPCVLTKGPITMADLNANTAIGYDMVGTLKVGGDAPSVCL